MKNIIITSVYVFLISVSNNSFGWSQYMAHVVVSEDIGDQLGFNREGKKCLEQVVAKHFGISVTDIEKIIQQELGKGGIDLPDDNEKSKPEYAYIYEASSRCSKGIY